MIPLSRGRIAAAWDRKDGSTALKSRTCRPKSCAASAFCMYVAFGARPLRTSTVASGTAAGASFLGGVDDDEDDDDEVVDELVVDIGRVAQ